MSFEEDRCLHVALPVAEFLEMLTECVNLRATTATRTRCVRHEVGLQTPFSGRGSRNAAEDLRPNIFQLNTERLTADKISIIEQLAYKNKAFIIVLQETHCTTADKLVIPNFSLAGSILSRNHGLATFVHDRLEWSLVDQSPEKELSDLWKIPTPEGHGISEPFRPEEFAAALRRLKPGKSLRLDSIFPEFILHAGSALKSWFCDFLNSCMRQLKIPKIWRRVLEVAIPKPEKPLRHPKSYRPISLLCVPFKILERRIYAPVETITDPLLSQEQAGFRHGRSAVDQVTLLT